MRISDWSSDVCSSDLASGGALGRDTRLRRLILEGRAHLRAIDVGQLAIDLAGLLRLVELHQRLPQPIKAVGRAIDRKSVVSGKRVSVRVDLGGRRLIKKKKTQKNINTNNQTSQ